MRYLKLAELYEELYNTGSSLAKTDILAEFLKKVGSDELEEIIILIQGKVFPEWDSREIGLGAKLALKAISSAAGISQDKVEKLWKKTGDLGETAELALKDKKQATLFSQSITTSKVIKNLQKLAELEGSGTVNHKVNLLKELLTSAEPLSAKYIIRTCLEELRMGVGSGIIRDSISKAFGVEKELVQNAYNMTTDFGEAAKTAKEHGNIGLKDINLTVGKPIKVMLYQKAKGITDAFERVGRPAAFEYKYDGFLCQIHKKAGKVWLFTRRQEDVTKQFPDIVKNVKTHIKASSFILDSEVIGVDKKTGKWLPFQNISERIKRKYNIAEIINKIPVIVNVFDVLYLNGKKMINRPFSERRKALEAAVKPVENRFYLAKQVVTDSVKEAERFYKESLKKGNEGVMVKNLEAEYKPGSRVGYGVKVKPVMESLDLVIVGAEWGHGKRGGWLSSFILACQKDGEFLEIGKMGTGIKEKKEMGMSFGELTKMLKPLILSEKGSEVKVRPKLVVEVAYEEIQKSPSYSSGYALRFPRLIGLREDKPASEASNLELVEELYKGQRGRH